jgi:hypothetical protein
VTETPVLQMRQAQLDTLRRIERPAARTRVLDHLAEHHAEVLHRRDTDEVAEIVDAAMDRASELGFSDEVDLAWFAYTSLEVSPRFSEQPRILALLTDASCELALRVRWTLANTSDEDWAEAGRA